MRSTSSAGVPDVRLSSPSSYPKRAPAHNQFIIEVRCEDIKMSEEATATTKLKAGCVCRHVPIQDAEEVQSQDCKASANVKSPL